MAISTNTASKVRGISYAIRAGVFNLQAVDKYQSGPVRHWAVQQEVSLSVLYLNHPETSTLCPLIRGKIFFHETCAWCQNGWGLLY